MNMALGCDLVIASERATMAKPIPNAAIAAMTLKQVLGASIPRDCGVVFGIYDLATRQVVAPDGPGLTEPPSSLEELEKLAVQLAGMNR